MGAVGEEDGAVDGGDGTGDQLVGDALEGRDQVGENHADAVVDDGDADGEGQSTGQGVNNHVVAASSLSNNRRICDVSGKSSHQVEEGHGKSRGDGGVAQEGILLGNLDLLCAVLLGVLSKQRTDCSGDIVGKRAEVTHGDLVAIGNLLGETLADGGKHGAHEAQEHTAHNDKLDILEARCLQNSRQQASP